jgi:excisionase family DNA binding protein
MTVWLTVPEAAAHIRAKSDRTIRDAIYAGHLPAYFYGPGKKYIRIEKDDLDQWIRSRPYEPGAAS